MAGFEIPDLSHTSKAELKELGTKLASHHSMEKVCNVMVILLVGSSRHHAHVWTCAHMSYIHYHTIKVAWAMGEDMGWYAAKAIREQVRLDRVLR